jgi:hypothetical protein
MLVVPPQPKWRILLFVVFVEIDFNSAIAVVAHVVEGYVMSDNETKFIMLVCVVSRMEGMVHFQRDDF